MAPANPVAPVASAPANPFMASVPTSPAAPAPSQASSVLPPVQATPIAPVVQASPIEPPVQASPIAPPVQASPIAPPVQASRIERPVYPNRFEPAEDVNPIVRPVVDEPVHASPVAPPVAEAALSADALNAPVLDAAVIAPPIVEAPVVEAPVQASPFEPPAQASPVEAPAQAGAFEPPVIQSRVEANAFESAPTEVAYSETPIEQTEEAQAQAQAIDGLSAENTAPAEGFAVDTAAPASADSVIGESEIQEQAASAQPYPAPGPARSFTSSGSEMPVVITTPAPYRRDSSAPAANLFAMGRELLPRAQAWSQKALRANPRALVIAAPLAAVLAIWGIRSAVSQPKHAPLAEANTTLPAQAPAAAPAQPITAAAEQAANAPSAAATSPDTSSAAPAMPGADPAELASALTHGLPALEALARKFPNDPQVGIALASQQAQAQRFEAAVESVERVISVAAKSAENGKVMGILWRSAQSSASEQSFAALRKLGARGSDIAFDLATTSGVRDSVRERAKTELTKSLSPEASADTRVASELLLAPDCAARKSLLARAEREGGKRTQAMLERFSRGAACASSSDKACNSCLTGSPELTHALAQLSAGGKK
ncbi:MAG TPA: hypothetical protein VJV79_20000 [Polyangiaceae bacterium]|nr:hypothetical protein [Polyangiaceae bacterium]